MIDLGVFLCIQFCPDKCSVPTVVAVSLLTHHHSMLLLCELSDMTSSTDTASSQQAVQYVLYESDSVDVTYADGSFIQLSPCGTTFVCRWPPSVNGHHPINGL